jgi:hypothetical protein
MPNDVAFERLRRRDLQLQHEEGQRNGHDPVGQSQEAIDPRHVLVVGDPREDRHCVRAWQTVGRRTRNDVLDDPGQAPESAGRVAVSPDVRRRVGSPSSRIAQPAGLGPARLPIIVARVPGRARFHPEREPRASAILEFQYVAG